MALTLTVGNKVVVPVKLEVNDDGILKAYKFDLKCRRLSGNELKERMARNDLLLADFLREVIYGWSGQTLVANDAGEPADFSPAALDVMLSLSGLPALLYACYIREAGAKEKNS